MLAGEVETTMSNTIFVANCTYFALPGSLLVWPKRPLIKKMGIWTLNCHLL
jgi:hypothetical protein